MLRALKCRSYGTFNRDLLELYEPVLIIEPALIIEPLLIIEPVLMIEN